MINILWTDDEIDLLKPHIIYLEEKGYNIVPAKSGDEALELLDENNFDLIFLDENMPGLSGLDTLNILKEKHSSIPVVMITKSEEEQIMEEAIGSKISDYLIKPVNPSQILLAIKKNIDTNRLIEETTTRNYQQDFRNISITLSSKLNTSEWYKIYKKLIYWELEIERSGDKGIEQILEMQKNEANTQYFKFVKDNYQDWLDGVNAPLMSHNIFKEKVLPLMNDNKPTYFVLIDNLRYDQWEVIKPDLLSNFNII